MKSEELRQNQKEHLKQDLDQWQDQQLCLLDDLVKMVLNEIERSQVLPLDRHHHAEYKMFYEDSNEKHLHQIFRVLQHQRGHSDLLHQHIPVPQHHESSRKSEISLIQILHVWKDK